MAAKFRRSALDYQTTSRAVRPKALHSEIVDEEDMPMMPD
jgi:predicted component of type VI protein secretion system